MYKGNQDNPQQVWGCGFYFYIITPYKPGVASVIGHGWGKISDQVQRSVKILRTLVDTTFTVHPFPPFHVCPFPPYEQQGKELIFVQTQTTIANRAIQSRNCIKLMSWPAAITMYQRLGCLIKRHFFSHSSGGWEAEVKVSEDSVLGECPLLGLQTAAI